MPQHLVAGTAGKHPAEADEVMERGYLRFAIFDFTDHEFSTKENQGALKPNWIGWFFEVTTQADQAN